MFMSMNKPVLSVIVVVAVLGAGFFGGIKYDQSHAASSAPMNTRDGGFQGGTRGGRGGVGGPGAGFINGEILSKDATSITVKLRDGRSKIVFVSGSTQVMKAAQGSIKDLTAGQQVTATGSANADGSVSAQTVQLRPVMPTSKQ